jgi:DEAD/DEAH box helicase domain-containing protein
MDSNALLERLKQQRFYRDQIAEVRELEARPPVYQNVAAGLPEPVAVSLGRLGIDRLYSHQSSAIDAVHAGQSVVVVTSTASGKTLCYTIPVMEALLADSSATALFIYPTKALAQDQLRGLAKWRQPDLGVDFMAGTYDGDTPQNLRRKLRDAGHVILTNPDMLHQGILPNHARWNRFFTHLKYIVIDEVHAYRGVFGSHLANVVRRLQRICQHYGASPQFICSSATIANPAEHAAAITGKPMQLVENDGSPRGRKLFVLWNPPPLVTAASGDPSNWRVGGDRRSARREAVKLMSMLVEEGIQTITFVRTRLAAELVFKDCRDRLRRVSRKLSRSVHAYRGGYLPEERREIERRLSEGDIMGVASTNALELGIDIGSLDACILVGYPGTIASTWQQAGRAGRSTDDSIVFLMAQNSPIDQYLMMHATYLFDQSPEQAVIDQDNPHVVVGHLKCAAAELPLSPDDADGMGPYAGTILELLEEDGAVRNIDDNWYWASSEFPAAGVNLRNIAGPVYTIQDEAEGERVIGTMDEITALAQVHSHAVYLHGADT